jgi:hypothetical protein
MKAFVALGVAVASAGVTFLAVATPASAYDDKAYAYAAGHMIARSDIPAVLGDFKKTMAFNAYSPNGPAMLCSIDGTGSTPSTTHTYPGGKLQFSANYSAKGGIGPSLSVTVNQYADGPAAIAAFDKAKKNVKNCTGTVTNSWTNTDTGSVSTYTTQTDNGVVPAVTTTGVESLFINVNSDSTATAEEAPYQSDQYTVVSLVNNVVISTTYYMNNVKNVTNKKRSAVNQVAFNAETAWLG